jgi:hypothetical protein
MASRRKQAQSENEVIVTNEVAEGQAPETDTELSALMKQLVRARASVDNALRRVRNEAARATGSPQQTRSEALTALLQARREASQVRNALIARLGYVR